MNPFDYQDLLASFFTPDDAVAIESELHKEVLSLLEPFRHAEFRHIATWPYEGGPAGALVLPDDTSAHGAYVRPSDDGRNFELVVCNIGWPIELNVCLGPPPASLAAANPFNYWVAAQPTFSATPRRSFVRRSLMMNLMLIRPKSSVSRLRLNLRDLLDATLVG